VTDGNIYSQEKDFIDFLFSGPFKELTF